MNTGPLFGKVLNTPKKITVLQGGGDAAKTVTALQVLATIGTQHPRELATVTGQTIPSVKSGALRSFQKYVLPDFQKYILDYNSTERTYTFYNGFKLEFKSFRDNTDAVGSERGYLFMNECNAENYETFWQLQRKTRYKIMLDYNPNYPFWVHEKLLSQKEMQFFNKVQLYIVDHRHNPYLSQEDHEAYESISDPDLFRVYSRGLTGKIKGLIFGNFKRWDFDWPNDATRIIWGIDYGYTNDPTALVKIAVGPGRRRVVKEICYEPGLSAERIVELLLANGLQPGQIIYSRLIQI
jgi:phage terminase large subunit